MGGLIKLEERFSKLEKRPSKKLTDQEVESFAREILEFVSKWWLHHILVEDKKYIDFLQKIADSYDSNS